jgi:cbb3-type cytochrome oxidase subunit 3
MLIRQLLIGWALAAPYYIAYLMLFVGPSIPVLFAYVCSLILLLAFFIVDIVWAFGPTRRRLFDYWAGTIVVNEANLLKP